MLSVNRSSLNFLQDTALYLRLENGQFKTLKEPGKTLRQMQVDLQKLPGRLYIRPQDHAKAMGEIQSGIYDMLKRAAGSDNLTAFKRYLVQMLDDALGAPDAYALEGLAGVVELILENFHNQWHKLKVLALEPFSQYSVALHSVNVMLLCLCHCLASGMSKAMSRTMGLAALMHDVGKAKLPPEILHAERKLTDEEYVRMRMHPRAGYNILRDCEYGGQTVPLAALLHHERLDGSGYPGGKTDLFLGARLIGLVDSYESLTADSRPYRQSLAPFFALEVIGKDVKAGKLDKTVFSRFVHSLS